MFLQHTLFAAVQQNHAHSLLYDFLPENIQYVLSSSLVDLGSLLTLGLAVILLFILNQRKKYLISSTSQMLEETDGHYQLLFQHSPLPLLFGDYSHLKKSLDQLSPLDQANLEQYFHQAPAMLDRCAAQIHILDANQAALQTYRVNNPEQLSSLLTTRPNEGKDTFLQELVQLLRYGTSEIQIDNLNSTGETITLLRRTVLAAEARESWERVFVALIDISEHLRLKKENQEFERRLQESKKLEALGNVSRSIAHDFNNILSPILSHSEMLLLEEAEPAVVRKHAQAIVDASARAQKLIHQIQTFGRQVGQEFSLLSLDNVICEVIELVGPTLPETIRLVYHSSQSKPFILGNPTQMHQVLMNIITNAVHAMETDGGDLTIRLDVLHSNSMAVEERARLRKTGLFQRLRIEDTGQGMSEEILAKIFEQHFTTKAWGRGTGIGLSTVLDILHNCNGEILVESTLGQGTIFTLYFPVVDKAGSDETSAMPILEPPGHLHPQGSEHILLVDDEQSIAEVTAAMLMRLGYKLTVCTDPNEALRVFGKDKENFDLLLVDMDMPQLNGLQFCKKVHALRENIKIIICTGFTDQELEEAFQYIGISTFVQKPVLIADLSQRIRTVLDRA